MKNIYLKKIGVCLLLTTLFSCTSYVEDMNVDPDLLTNVGAKDLFQGILLGNQFFQTSGIAREQMIWMNQANGENRQYITSNNWNNATASAFDDNWDLAYVNCITQSKILQLKADKEDNKRIKGAAQVIEAFCLGTVTSLWGDVPYSELDITGGNLAPKYDSQASVYNSVQTLLNNAIINLSSTTGGVIPSASDIYYAGNTSKWIKLAYSLKARFYLHVKDYSKAKTNALLGIDNANDDLKALFGQSYGQNFNPYYSFLVYDRDDYMSGDSYAARILDNTSSLYRGNAKTDESARFRFNYLTDGNYFTPYELNYYCGFDWDETNGKFGGDSNMPLVTYGEMLLIIAEADARTSFSTGLASYNNYRDLLNTGYSIGIDNNGYDTETFRYDAYTAADFAASGMENVSGSLTNQNALLREIYQERYIYFIGSFECFTDFGRTNNIAGIQLKTGNAGTPQRFLYSQKEINSNPNTPKPIPTIVTKTPVNN
jgi:hypothetical protein